MKNGWIHKFIILTLFFNILTPLPYLLAMDSNLEIVSNSDESKTGFWKNIFRLCKKTIQKKYTDLTSTDPNLLTNDDNLEDTVTQKAGQEITREQDFDKPEEVDPQIKPETTSKTIIPVDDKIVRDLSESTSGFWGSLSSKWENTKNAHPKICGALEWVGLATREHYFQNPEKYEGFNTLTAARDASIAFLFFLFGKQYFDLRKIDIMIGRSETNSSGDDFLFGSWKEGDFKTYFDISHKDNAKKLKIALWDEVKNGASCIHIKDDTGKRIDPKDVNKLNLQAALNKEKKELRKCLYKISYFTDVPQEILKLVRAPIKKLERNSSGDSYLWYQNVPFHQDCIKHFKQLNVNGLNKFGKDLLEQNNFKQKGYSWFRHVFFSAPGCSCWRIWRWRLGNWYGKSSRLYWKVYLKYLRTYALYEVVSLDDTTFDNEQPAIEKLLEQVNAMIIGQDGVYNDHLPMRRQVALLDSAVKTLTSAKIYYNKVNKNNIVKSLKKIGTHFNTISSTLLSNQQGNQQDKKPANDSVHSLLNTIQITLKTIIKDENKENNL